MPNLNSIILTAADYNVVWTIPTSAGKVSYPMQTTSELTYEDDAEGEFIHAIGTKEPIGNKTNSRSYKGTFAMQTGELNAILQLTGFTSAIQIEGATLSIAAIVGGFFKCYRNVNILKDSGSIQAGSKGTINKLDWHSIGLK